MAKKTLDDYKKEFLGKQVEDTLTGFKGICDCLTVWLNGCIRLTIQPRVGDDGKMPDNKWVDVEQVIVTSGKPALADGKRTGGPADNNPTNSF